MTQPELNQTNILILSIPHTGTHFVADLLGVPCKFGPRLEGTYGTVRVAHTMHEFDKIIYQCIREGYKIISPMRHPLKLVDTFAKRRTKPQDYLEMLYRLRALELTYGIYWLPLDSPKRDDFLKKINEDLGMSLETSWTPVSCSDGTKKASDLEVRKAREILEDNKDLFDLLY